MYNLIIDVPRLYDWVILASNVCGRGLKCNIREPIPDLTLKSFNYLFMKEIYSSKLQSGFVAGVYFYGIHLSIFVTNFVFHYSVVVDSCICCLLRWDYLKNFYEDEYVD